MNLNLSSEGIAYYRYNPSAFAEDILGLKLTSNQKEEIQLIAGSPYAARWITNVFEILEFHTKLN